MLYLDGDTIITTDFAEIWNQPWWADHFALAGCLDQGIGHWKSQVRYYQKNGVPLKNYINAGVLLMNMKKIREEYDLTGSTRAILERHPDLPLPDQDILNLVFENDLRTLPEKYNLPAGLDEKDAYNHACIHYIFCEKP